MPTRLRIPHTVFSFDSYKQPWVGEWNRYYFPAQCHIANKWYNLAWNPGLLTPTSGLFPLGQFLNLRTIDILSFVVGAALGIVRNLAASLASTHPPDASSTLPDPSPNDQKCLQAWPHSRRGSKCSPLPVRLTALETDPRVPSTFSFPIH